MPPDWTAPGPPTANLPNIRSVPSGGFTPHRAAARQGVALAQSELVRRVPGVGPEPAAADGGDRPAVLSQHGHAGSGRSATRRARSSAPAGVAGERVGPHAAAGRPGLDWHAARGASANGDARYRSGPFPGRGMAFRSAVGGAGAGRWSWSDRAGASGTRVRPPAITLAPVAVDSGPIGEIRPSGETLAKSLVPKPPPAPFAGAEFFGCGRGAAGSSL